MATKSKYRRILLKLSGEALAAPGERGYDRDIFHGIAQMIAAASADHQVAVMVGGGNIWRGYYGEQAGIDRTASDNMGILASVMNALALQTAVEQAGVDSRVQTAITMSQVAEPYIRRRAIRHLEKGRVVIFGGGLGQPFFTTDTAGAQRALEIEADALVKGTKVDGVYDDDPATNPNAKRYETLSYAEALEKKLGFMDSTAIALCRENALPLVVLNILDNTALPRLLKGEQVGTEVTA